MRQWEWTTAWKYCSSPTNSNLKYLLISYILQGKQKKERKFASVRKYAIVKSEHFVQRNYSFLYLLKEYMPTFRVMQLHLPFLTSLYPSTMGMRMMMMKWSLCIWKVPLRIYNIPFTPWAGLCYCKEGRCENIQKFLPLSFKDFIPPSLKLIRIWKKWVEIIPLLR